MRQPGWKWPLNRSPPPPEHVNIYSELSLITHLFLINQNFFSSANNTSGKFLSDKDSYYCDRNLMQSLVYDAKITEWFSRNSTTTFNEKG